MKPLQSPVICDPALFSGERALERVRDFISITPRDAGTDGAEKAARYLHSQLQAIGVESEVDEFDEVTPSGRMTFRNVVGRIPGTGKGIVIFGSHYDTKSGIGAGFQGANDSGSSTGVLLEMASALKAGPRPSLSVLLAFFDGEECVLRYGDDDGLHGSRRLARKLSGTGVASNVVAVIILDMVGDKDLDIALPANSSAELCSAVFAAAREEGVRDRFSLCRSPVLDDHVPFLEAGMRAVDMIDFTYGSGPGMNDYWHTPQDTIDKLSGASLEVAGRVAIRVINSLQKKTGVVRSE